MQKVKKSSTASVPFFGLASLVFLSACSTPEIVEEVKPVEIKTIEVKRPAPIVPPVDQLSLRDIEWKIITPDNVDEVFSDSNVVLFSITSEGYENLSLNLSDLRAMIQQQQEIIAIYEKSYK